MKRIFSILVVLFLVAVVLANLAGLISVLSKVLYLEGPAFPHNHSFGNWTVTTPATHLTEGEEIGHCRCGETQTQAIDGTKIKAKASINNLTNQEQIDLLKDILKKSIELDEEEDEILGDESGNSVPKELIDKKSFEEIYKKVTESTKGDRNEFKLRRSSRKLLDQAKKDKKSAKKVLQKVEKIDSELKKTTNDVISINDPDHDGC